MCGALLAHAAAAALPDQKPWPLRSLGNGHSHAVFDHAKGALTDWWLGPYKALSPDSMVTADILFDAYFGLAPNNAGLLKPGQWAGQMPLQPAAVQGYAGAAGVVQETRAFAALPGVTLTTYAFLPQTLAGRCAVLIGQVHNAGADSQSIAMPLLLNFHLGPGAPQPSAQGEKLALQGDHLTESGAAGTIVATGIDAAAMAMGNLFQTLQSGGAQISAQTAEYKGDDMVGTLVFAGAVPAGGQMTGGAVVCYGSNSFDTPVGSAWIANRSAEKILADELQWWADWHAADQLPPTLPAAEKALLQKQLTLLKMAQSQQPDQGGPNTGHSPHGQIVASMPPGQWNMTWPRDQSYAAVALQACGHAKEAQDALQFVLNGQAGGYQSQVGAPYAVSVTRYFGGGLEESDSNENGPNIELDGFGLVLWQAGRTLSGGKLASSWTQLRDLVAKPLLGSIDATGLVKPDSSIWEVHWNGQQKHFAYTTLAAVRGLCGAAQLAKATGDLAFAQTCVAGAQKLNQALPAKLGPNGTFLRGNLEEPASQALDLAAVDAFADGQLPAWGPQAQASWQAWQALRAGGGPGFFRNDDGGWYDAQEWLFIDLRVLRWLDRALAQGAPLQADRDALRQRILKIAAAGDGQIPELIATSGAEAGQFAGAVPMMGFGAGALLLALAPDPKDDLTACLAPPAVAEAPLDAGSAETAPEAVADASATAPDAAASDLQADDLPLADNPVGADFKVPAPPPRSAPVSASSGCAAMPSALPAWMALLPLTVCWCRRRR